MEGLTCQHSYDSRTYLNENSIQGPICYDYKNKELILYNEVCQDIYVLLGMLLVILEAYLCY